MGNKKSKVYAIENCKVVYQDGYYDGPTVNGQPNGWGTFYYNNGEYCVGTFINGILTGTGTHYCQNGTKLYEGEWRDSVYHGVGRYYQDDCLWYWGEWRMGEPVGMFIKTWVFPLLRQSR